MLVISTVLIFKLIQMSELTNSKKQIVEQFIRGSKHNVFLHYLVPLTDNKFLEFGIGVIDSAHISESGLLIYLVLKKKDGRTTERIKRLNNFKFFITKDGRTIAVFNVPAKYLKAMSCLIDGKYTEIPPKIKYYICTNGILKFNAKATKYDMSSTHIYLQALYEHSPLRSFVAAYLGVKLSEVPVELVPKLETTSTIFIENWVGH